MLIFRYFQTFSSTVWLPTVFSWLCTFIEAGFFIHYLKKQSGCALTTKYALCPYHYTDDSLCFFLSVQAGDALIQLYNHFILDFETKINLLKFAHFTVVVSRQYLEKDAGIDYLEGVISKLHDTREARVEEPILYVKMQIATFLLEKGNKKGCKKLLEEGKTTLDTMVDVDPSVHGAYYWVCSQYHKAHQDYCEFYKSSLLYLAYTTVESLSEPFKQVLHITSCLCFATARLGLFLRFLIGFIYVFQNLAFDLSLAALLGENIYNFGELLAHPIVSTIFSPCLLSLSALALTNIQVLHFK